MEHQTVKLFLELPGELVVMQVPKVKAERLTVSLDAVQLPLPPPYDPSGKGITSASNPYRYNSSQVSPIVSSEPQQLPFPPPYDPGTVQS